jgi:hypothetical protein
MLSSTASVKRAETERFIEMSPNLQPAVQLHMFCPIKKGLKGARPFKPPCQGVSLTPDQVSIFGLFSNTFRIIDWCRTQLRNIFVIIIVPNHTIISDTDYYAVSFEPHIDR